MKPKYDLTIKFGVKGAVATAGCVTLAYGEGQENEMVEDFRKYLESPEWFEKMYWGGLSPLPQVSTLSEGPLQTGVVHGHRRKQL